MILCEWGSVCICGRIESYVTEIEEQRAKCQTCLNITESRRNPTKWKCWKKHHRKMRWSEHNCKFICWLLSVSILSKIKSNRNDFLFMYEHPIIEFKEHRLKNPKRRGNMIWIVWPFGNYFLWFLCICMFYTFIFFCSPSFRHFIILFVSVSGNTTVGVNVLASSKSMMA